MTLTATTYRNEYSTTAGLFAYAYTFRILDQTHLQVYLAGVLKALTTDYTVSGVGEAGGGSITLVADPGAGASLIIVRNVPETQLIDYVPNDPFPAQTHEDGLDKATMILQQHRENLDRAVKLPVTSLLKNIPMPVPGAGYYIRWNAGGTALEAVSVVNDPGSYLASGAGAVSRSITSKLGDVISVFDFLTAAQRSDVAGRTGALDITAGVQAALNAGKVVVFPDGVYRASDEFILDNNHCLILSGAVQINQVTDNKSIFKATAKDNVWIHCNGAVLYGKGNYSNAWGDYSTHLDRPIYLINCTNSGVTHPTIKNASLAGIVIRGGDGITIDTPIIEGTHTHGVPISQGDNYQFAIFVLQDSIYGPVDNLKVISPDMSGTALGFYLAREADVATGGTNRSVTNAYAHNIPGQHAFYVSDGQISIPDAIVDTVGLDAIKVQVDDGFVLENVSIPNFNVSNAPNSHALEITSPVSGEIHLIRASGVCHDVQRGLGINGRVKDAQISIVVKDATQHGAIIQGDDVQDIDLHIHARNLGRHGVQVLATNSSGIRIWLVVRQPSTSSSGTYDAVNINSATVSVELFNPVATDAGANMGRGLYLTAGTLKVRGSAVFTGATTYGARADVALAEWPTEVTVSGTTAPYLNIDKFRSSQPTEWTVQTPSAANVLLWNRTLDDESVYLVRAEITGKLAGSAQRAAYVESLVVYRDGGAAVQEGATDTDVSVVSAGFAGAHAWSVSGNTVRLDVNSGGAATYDWKLRVTVVPLVV